MNKLDKKYQKVALERTIFEIIAGLVSGVLIIVIAIAVTALIFNKPPLTLYFSSGLSCILISACIVNLITSTRGFFSIGISRPEPAVAVIISIIFAHISNHSHSNSDLLPTLVATLTVTSILTGIVMFLLGYFRLGQMARFLPYPVIGGVLGGTAWFMAVSSYKLINQAGFSVYKLPQNSMTVFFAVFLLILLRKNSRLWLLPISIIIFSLLINAGLYIQGLSHETAMETGWLFSTISPSISLETFQIDMLKKVHWSIILHEFPYIVSAIALTIVMLLLNISALEPILKKTGDLEQDLKISGIGNFIGGLFNGLPSNLSLSGSLLNVNLGAASRISSIIASLTGLFLFLIYPEIIYSVPIPAVAGLLLYISLKLVYEWFYKSWFKLPHTDYYILLSILVLIIAWNYISGVAVGVLLSCLVFIVYYTKISVIKYSSSGFEIHSKVIRVLYEEKWLATQGNQLLFFKLQGYLFFGRAKLLFDQINKLINKNSELKYLILDFELVNGIDSSAVYSFIRLQQIITPLNIQIIFCHCSDAVITQLKQQGIFANNHSIYIFPDSDTAIEWYEDEQLKTVPNELKLISTSINDVLSQFFTNPSEKETFINYLVKKQISAKEYLCRQGEIASTLFFIESGSISIFFEVKNKPSVRIAKSGAGTIVGEISFYLNVERTASVISETDCTIYELTRENMQNLEKAYPNIALTFHKIIISELAKRLVRTDALLKADIEQ